MARRPSADAATSRPADPRAKPVPPAPKDGPRTSGLGPRTEKKKKQIRAPKETLPWKKRREEYDPDSGEMKPRQHADPSHGRPEARSPRPEAHGDATEGRITVHPAGYLAATTTNYGLAAPSQGRFTLDRVRVDGTDGVAGLAQKLAQLHVLE